MKFLLAFLLSLVPAGIHAAGPEWELFAVNDEGNRSWYIRHRDIGFATGITSTWVREESTDGTNSLRLVAIHCDKRTFIIVSHIGYDQRGRVVESWEVDERDKPEMIPPETIIEMLGAAVCAWETQ